MAGFDAMNTMTTLQTALASSGRLLRGTPRPGRRGAILTVEMLLVLPVIFGLILALVELSMLWVGNHKLAAAARAGCRVATLPGSTDADVVDAVRLTLGNRRLADAVKVNVAWAQYTGDPVTVELQAPMKAAAPDLLGLVGFTLADRHFTVSTVMRRE